MAILTINSSLGGLSFAQDANGKWGYKVGADAVIPFKSGKKSDKLAYSFGSTTASVTIYVDVTDISKITLKTTTTEHVSINNQEIGGNAGTSYSTANLTGVIPIKVWGYGHSNTLTFSYS